MSNHHAIDVIDLHAGYGRIEVLHGVSFAVPSGSVFALLGPNGGGKSTTLKVISGEIAPTSGCVHIAGAHVNAANPDALARAGVTRIPEGRGIFPNLTVDDNLRIWTYAAGMSLKAVHRTTFARFPRLEERRHQRAGTMSGGEQQMLAMSRALVARPAVLLLDEISMGLAPIIVSELYALVRQLAEEGITILLVEQFATTALRVADFAAVMTQGRVVAVGEPQDIQEQVSAAYLGGAA
ncbi:MAG TPA: ABC transporter ATP-binding protein [Mycobacteriales bacterium]|nr:ABC transporter ATP-binding protein [Mycobacteriales bacterium]HWA65431.1 ABC transporter ATP-binding protein [Mycobacteriales bacterium]